MGRGETISAELNCTGPTKLAAGSDKGIPIGAVVSRQSRESSSGLFKKQAVVLDMGEASREQGFRMNGCR